MTVVEQLTNISDQLDAVIAELSQPVPIPTPPPPPPPATTLVNWTGKWALAYSDTQLAVLAKLGVNGLVIAFGWPPGGGLGGDPAAWTAIPDDFSARCKAAGITHLYASFEPGDYNHPVTAFGDWFSDAEWTKFNQSFIFLLTTLRQKGWQGIAWDNEMYPGANNQRPTWNWAYPGNTHGEIASRARVYVIGTRLGQLIRDTAPGCEIITYHDRFGDKTNWSYAAQLDHIVYGSPVDQYALREVKADFYNGLMSVAGGVGKLILADASFYYGTWPGAGWGDDAASMSKSAVETRAYLSRVITNHANVYPEPMVLLGPSNGDGSLYTVQQAMVPDRALVVAKAARAASTGGMVVNYDPDNVLQYNVRDFTGDVVNGVPRLVHADLSPAYAAARG